MIIIDNISREKSNTHKIVHNLRGVIEINLKNPINVVVADLVKKHSSTINFDFKFQEGSEYQVARQKNVATFYFVLSINSC